MDIRLINYILALAEITRIEIEDIKIHLPLKRTTAVIGTTVTVIASQTEPHDINLPANVVWACFDKTSSMYKKLYRRLSKTPTDITEHTWELITDFDSMWEAQYYFPGEEPSTSITLATIQQRGIITLSTDPLDAENPVVVSQEDPRNTNKRNPLPHDEMHENYPAEELITDSGIIDIVAGSPVAGSVLYGTSVKTSTVYRKMGKSDICENLPAFTTALDPTTLAEAPYTGMLILGTMLEKFSGSPVGTTIPVTVAVYSQHVNARGFRKFLGYFNLSSLKINGVVQQTLTVSLGENLIEATVQAPSFPPLTLKAMIKGV